MPNVDAASDAAPPDAACAAGEQTLIKLGCKDLRGRPLGGPNRHGESWQSICRQSRTDGVDMKPTCIASAATCAEVEQCR